MPTCTAGDRPDWAGPEPENLLADVTAVPDSLGALYAVKCFDSEYTFCVDTGASVTALDIAFRGSLGNSAETANVTTAARDARFEVFAAPKLELGGFRLRSQHALCVDLRSISKELGHNVDGILGWDSVSRQVLELDLAGERIRLFREVPDKTRRSDLRLRIHRDDDGLWTASASLPDGTEEFVLDTGYIGEVEIARARFEKLQKAKCIRHSVKTEAITVSGEIESVRGKLSSFKLGTHEHERLPVTSGKFSLIGQDYLRRYIATFDFREGCLYLRPSRDYAAGNPRENRSGLQFATRGESLIVGQVAMGSPGYWAGIRKGDRILRLHGRSAEGLPVERIPAILSRDGEEVEIAFSRKGKEIVRSFKLRDLSHPRERKTKDRE